MNKVSNSDVQLLLSLKKGKGFDYASVPKGLLEDILAQAISAPGTLASEEALALLVDYLLGSVLSVLGKDMLTNSAVYGNDLFADLKSEAVLFIYDRMLKFKNDGKGSLAAYVRDGATKEFAREVKSQLLTPGTLDRSWARIRAAYQAEKAKFLVLQGRTPTLDEAKILVKENLISRRMEYVKNQKPGMKQAELLADAEAYLVKQGDAGALKDLSSIIALGLSDARLDAPLTLDAETSLASTLVATEKTSSENILDLIYLIALGDEQWARPALAAKLGLLGQVEGTVTIADETIHTEKDFSYSKFAVVAQEDKALVKKTLNDAQVRLLSPLAQFAYTTATIEHRELNDLAGYSAKDFS